MLKLQYRQITPTQEISDAYIESLKSIGDGLCSINQSFQHWCFIDVFYKNIEYQNMK